MTTPAGTLTRTSVSWSKRVWKVLRHWELYLFIAPALLYAFVFLYYPMYGVQIAFKDFRIGKGIWGSEWVGLKHFINFLRRPACITLIKNTLVISMYSLLAGFPFPILFALTLNEICNARLKRFTQTVSYAPHFISTVVMVSMIVMFLDPKNGVINKLLGYLGIGPYAFLTIAPWFPSVYVISGIWQNVGWSSVIYLSALASINTELHEAAMIDGANRLQRIRHVNLPSILPTITILLILSAGGLMSVGFEKVYLMQNPLNTQTSEIISTFVYKMGLQSNQYSFSAAIGLFNSLVNFALLFGVNTISRRVSETSLW